MRTGFNKESLILFRDDALVRFLEARKWKVDKAYEMIQNAIEWRKKNGIFLIV